MKIRNKIFLFTFFLLSTALLLFTIFTIISISKELNIQKNTDILRGEKVLDKLIEEKKIQIQLQVETLSNNDHLTSLVLLAGETKNFVELDRYLKQILSSAGYDFYSVFDRDDNLLTSTLKEKPPFVYDESGGKLVTIDGKLPAIYASKLISYYNDSVGRLIVGNYIDDSYLANLSNVVGYPLTLRPLKWSGHEDINISLKDDNAVINVYLDYSNNKLILRKRNVIIFAFSLWASLLLVTTVIGIWFFQRFLTRPIEWIVKTLCAICINTNLSDVPVKELFEEKRRIRPTAELKVVSQKVEELVVSLKNSQNELKVSEKMAAIGQSTAMVAHDVRKPLASMKALLTMLPEIKDNPDQLNKMMVDVDRNIEKTNTMLNDILEFSRDSTALELKDHDPQSIIISALSDALRNHSGSDVSIEYDLKHKDYLHVDGDRIIRILTNIIDNALDAMSNDSDRAVGILKVITRETDYSSNERPEEASREGEEGSSRRSLSRAKSRDSISMKIIISNTGAGIPPDILPKIFDPFFTHGKKGGTGLGLSICQKVIQMHGGRIEARSNDGRGTMDEGRAVTEFIIELPATEGQLSINESELIHHSSELKAFHEEEKVRVDYGDTANTSEFMRINKERDRLSHLLIVDDEPLFRETVRTLLNGLSQVRDHIRVVEADSAEMAFKLFDDRIFDYVVADIDLGKNRMNGYEFTQIILEKYPGAYVLIHSNKRKDELDNYMKLKVNGVRLH